LEIKAKLSLAVDGFKSGLSTAKKELDTFGASGSKFNSKFAQDIRSSFDNIGPGIKRVNREVSRDFDKLTKEIASNNKAALGNIWNPLSQGFNKATAKIAVNSAVIGGFFKNMTKSASSHAKDVDALIERNTRNRIIGSQRAADFEARVAQSNRRIDKASMREQYGARPAGSATGRGSVTAPDTRIKLASFTAPAQDKGSLKSRIDLYKQDAKELAASTAYKAKYEAVYQMGRLSRATAGLKQETAAMWANAKESAAATAYKAKYEAVYQLGRVRQAMEANRAISQQKKMDLGALVISDDFERKMASTRYALYDVGQRFLAFGAIVVSSMAEAIKTSAKFESSFTSVERTTGMVLGKSGGHAEALKKQLLDLSTTMPVSFEQITQIATLGAQMGIASDSVDNFAVTVTKFSAITGISVETAAQSFGRLGQLLHVNANEFENLSSAITYTGVNSVATDQEILSMSESIAAAGVQSGFSAHEVIGLSAALASLKVRPEEARGVLARLFREIESQVSQAGTGLDDFSQILGVTSADAANLWKQDPSAFFGKFLEGAQATGKLTETLTALGITNTRELNVIQRLSQSQGLLTSTMADSEKQYLLGTYSSEAYGLVVDDLNSKMTMFQSTLEIMKASFGDAMSGGIKIVIDGLTGLAKLFTQMPTGIKATVALLGVFAAITAVIFGSLAMGIAGLLAMKLAMKNLASEGIQASISLGTFNALVVSMIPSTGLAAGALKLLGISAKTSSTGLKTLAISMRTVMIASGVGIALVALTMALDAFGNSAKDVNADAIAAGNAMLEAGGGADAFGKALAADKTAIKDGAAALGTLTLAYDEVASARVKDEEQALAVGRAAESMVDSYKNQTDVSGGVVDAYDAMSEASAAYSQSIKETEDSTKSITAAMGQQTAAFYVEAFSKYKGANGDQATFWENYLDPKNAQLKTTLESFGFNVGELVAASMSKSGGGAAYVANLQKQIADASVAIQSRGPGTSEAKALGDFGKSVGWTSEQISLIQKQLSTDPAEAMYFKGIAYTEFDAFIAESVKGLDGLSVAATQSQAVIEANKKTMTDLGYSAEVADGLVGGLSESLKGYMDAAFSGEAANNAAADSFQTFASGVMDVTDGLAGGRQDVANWVGYMNSAREAAIANGEGFAGSVTRMLTGIEALGKSGKSIKKPFEDMKKYLVTAASGEGFSDLGKKIATATDPSQLSGIIDAFITLSTNQGTAGKSALAYGIALKGALTLDPALLKTLMAAFTVTTDTIANTGGVAKTALEKLQEAIEKVFKAGNAKMGLEAALDSLGESMAKNKKVFSVYSEAGRTNLENLKTTINSIAENTKGAPQAAANSLESLRQAMIKTGVTAGPAMAMITAAIKATGKKGKAAAAEVKMILGSITTSFKEAARSEARTISDYISDISSILNDALRNRYGKQEAADSISGAWRSIGKAATDAANAIAEANKEIKATTADKAVLEYQLGIAVKYGDTKRAAVIQAKLDDATKSLAENNAKLAEAQAASNKSLTDSTEAGAGNRTQIRGIVSSMNDYLMSLARAGKSNAELKVEAKTLSDDFMKQGKALGFAEKELQTYADAFTGDFTKAVNAVPNDITLKVNTDPALAAIEEFVAKAKDSLGTIGIIAPTATDTKATVKAPITAAQKATIASLASQVSTTTAQIVALQKSPIKNAAAILVLEAKRDRLRERAAAVTAPVTKANGGYISGPGTSTSDSIPAMLSNGEYVIKANAVSKYGVDFMNSINQMKAARPMPSGIGAGGVGGSSVVYLSPEDRQLLRAAMDRPIALYTENSKIAQSANAGNVVLAQRGTN
jgi:TP901 family phage tail tape measure protein